MRMKEQKVITAENRQIVLLSTKQSIAFCLTVVGSSNREEHHDTDTSSWIKKLFGADEANQAIDHYQVVHLSVNNGIIIFRRREK